MRGMTVRIAALIAVTAATVCALARVATADSTRHATFGKSITLPGLAGERLAVRPYELVDPLPTSSLDDPGSGFRLVGVRVSIRNVGRRTAADSPSNGAKLITGGGTPLDSYLFVGDECNSFGGHVTIPPGQVRRGCIAFKVPQGALLRYFELTWSSGFAEVTGQWSTHGAVPQSRRRLSDDAAERAAAAQAQRTLAETVVAPTSTKVATPPECSRFSRLRVGCEFEVTTRARPGQHDPTVFCRYHVDVRMARKGRPTITAQRSSPACQSTPGR